ncbi:glycosyltransferase [Fulvivirgaceae bacterium BMA12]|uniref:Glycosyltransferase n=1 Tax=Agaribacillus aureus TaxID=3051825 RepID=A0ABT8L9G9_9BACT|nr:glycosyltransferase [Fulvivirgaceae bacterium BMA12]
MNKRKKPRYKAEDSFLIEVAWEVCHQVGGIYTVIKTKAKEICNIWHDNYCLVGPYFKSHAEAEFEPLTDMNTPYGRVVKKLQRLGIDAHYGKWLIAGRPQAILLNPHIKEDVLESEKFRLWEKHRIESHHGDQLLNEVIGFGYLLQILAQEFGQGQKKTKQPVIWHVHEWMSATTLPDINKENPNLKTVFTTHATMLGRYISGNNDKFYEQIKNLNWLEEAKKYHIEPQARIERNAANAAQICTTVSEITAKECQYFLGRKPEIISPNGLSIERFSILHEVQNIHQQFKEEIHQFVIAHFFQHYTFDLDKTLYFFTSGRYEYHNKGFDLTLEALSKLNKKLIEENIDKNVVMFFITRKPCNHIRPQALESRGILEEVRQTCEKIEKQIGDKLFYETVANENQKLPEINKLVEDYWKLRLRRTLQSWKRESLPLLATHQLVDEENDEILNFLQKRKLNNKKEDKVKIVYHPDFISPMNPLFGMEYGQFVRGCHLGIFPSFYEPWGYTPLECLASGVPAITSDLSGFGDYVLKYLPEHQEAGIYVVNRKSESFSSITSQLANFLFSFVIKGRRDRINMRNRSEDASEKFDWNIFANHYRKAYNAAIHQE